MSCVLVACGSTATDPSESSDPGSRPPVATASQTAEPVPAAAVSVGVPRSLDIEAIGVAAPILAVGINADGSQEVPTSVHEVGWWESGAEPAAAGNGVLVGHTYSRGDGVFDDLGDLREGDTITVTGSARTADFVVEKTAVVPVEDFADVADDIYQTTGEPRLVVMTCGDYDGDSYRATVIVYARLFESHS